VSTSAVDHELYSVKVKRSNVPLGIGGEYNVAITRCLAEKSGKTDELIVLCTIKTKAKAPGLTQVTWK
jgi:hypothetical protein